MSDPAGWYPDPTTRHELRYWDGYAWLDDVSDHGTTARDALGGQPMPAPSEAAAKAQTSPAPAPASNRTPLYIAVAAVAAVLVIVVAVVLLRGGDDGKGTTALNDKQVTFQDDVQDVAHPVVHPVHVKANTVVVIDASTDNKDLTPAFVVLSDQKTIDSVNSKIQGISGLLSAQLRDACSNLREEDIGAKGTVVYRADKSANPGEDLHTFMVVIAEGDYEVVPVLVDADGKCGAGKSTLKLDPKALDFSAVSNSDDLASVLSNDSDLASFFSS